MLCNNCEIVICQIVKCLLQFVVQVLPRRVHIHQHLIHALFFLRSPLLKDVHQLIRFGIKEGVYHIGCGSCAVRIP